MSLFNAPFDDKYSEFYGINVEQANINNLIVNTFDVTAFSADVAIIGDLSVTGTATIADEDVTDSSIDNLTINNEILYLSNSDTSNSISSMLVESGTHTWSASEAPGSNILSISIDSNEQRDYDLYIDYLANPSAGTNFLGMRFNDDTSNEYAYNVFTDYSSAQDASGVGGILFLYLVGTGLFTGAMKCDLLLSKQINNSVYGFTNYTQQSGTGGLSSRTSNFVWNSGDSDTINTIDIDVSDTNHNGWQIYYRLIRKR